MSVESSTAKQFSLHASLQALEHFKYLYIWEFLSLNRCSRTREDKCRLVSPTYTELHSSQVNMYTIFERSDLGTQSLAVLKFLILKEVNASLI